MWNTLHNNAVKLLGMLFWTFVEEDSNESWCVEYLFVFSHRPGFFLSNEEIDFV